MSPSLVSAYESTWRQKLEEQHRLTAVGTLTLTEFVSLFESAMLLL
jgi:hypothetical protein